MRSRKIMIIRHAEKPTTTPAVAGVDPDGNQSDEDLIVQGWQRAGALARFFAPLNGQPAPGLAVPNAIYASAVAKHSQSLRPQHTALPLSQLLQLNINLEYAKEDAANMAKAVADRIGPTLIAWEHEDIPGIVNAIVGNSAACPQQWHDDRFDVVWVLDQDEGSNVWRFSQVMQMLLAGDRAQPIGQ
ncbi:histidine phosphatase family protein [Chromobacterium sphagni]|uniref:Histidine phosphatase family protein n=1 Tax=Chromobacterium sphagni TaxID=1903179 RepID=A0A1S1X4L7_9NEIS|nr:histidine phosphatase family protein [Chromobacterium sphagni]OHX14431.1 hypothetical protein BI347_13660 [Chromobacterium sphagni]OHX19809.1 hypothetical protein BI344_16580 [Chromobacterium sphagni]